MKIPVETSEASHAMSALRNLCGEFFEEAGWIADCEVLLPNEMPPLARKLLAHHEHMTPTLREYYGGELQLTPLTCHHEADSYARKILLTLQNGNDERVVEFGIVHIDLSRVGARVREQIVSQKTPLGDILRQAGVMTRVDPKWFVRFPSSTPIAKFFTTDTAAVYGRLAMIYVNGEPAIELLEVISAAE